MMGDVLTKLDTVRPLNSENTTILP